MIYLCACGRFKSAQPHKSAITKDWICPACADRDNKPRSVMSEQAYAEKLADSVRRTKIEMRSRSRDETGRQPRLKISGR